MNCQPMGCEIPVFDVCVFVCVGGTFRYNSLLQQRAKLDDLEKALREEQMRIALEKEQHKTTASECCRLREEKDW